MYKIFLTCRNRLAITCKCITALKKHSVLPHQIYVYDNLTNYKLQEHFMYFYLLLEKKLISHFSFNTSESTFNAFSKAVSCNQFGYLHEMDPEKNNYDFLVFLDNDIIVTPEWDQIISNAWKSVKDLKMNDIHVISQLPGGIIAKNEVKEKIGNLKGNKIGKHGGSGFWTVRPSFFQDIGFLETKHLIGQNKKHDQHYWIKLAQKTNNRPYILGLNHKLAIHCGKLAGSVCNVLTKNKNCREKDALQNLIKFEKSEQDIDTYKFEDFYKKIQTDQSLILDW